MATMLISGNALFCPSKSLPNVPSLSHRHKPSKKITFLNYSNNAKQNVQRVWDTAHEKKINETAGFEQDLGANALLSSNTLKEYGFKESNEKNIAMLELDSIERGTSGFRVFMSSYFMFHGLDASDTGIVLEYLPILLFIESYVYQNDQMNEKVLEPPNNGNHIFGEKDEREIQSRSDSCFQNDPFGPLKTVLKDKGLLTERIIDELKQGEEYWALERKLCYALKHNEEILVEDVIRAHFLRAFDFRAMNLVLYQMLGTKVEESYVEFLRISDFLNDIWDDLYDYEQDVLKNTFNVLRFFVKIYGASDAPKMMMNCINEYEDKYKSLMKSLDPELALRYQKIVDSPIEGGDYVRHPVGSWTLPTVIEDEELYRSKFNSMHSGNILK